jgi:membrane protein insertase Oxa1/YidC/SpoIIIJ
MEQTRMEEINQLFEEIKSQTKLKEIKPLLAELEEIIVQKEELNQNKIIQLQQEINRLSHL